MEDLTRREMEIAEAMTYGGDVKDVAEMLYISPMTVESHLKNIYRKLEIQRATELVRWWMCRHYNVTLEAKEWKRKAIALVMLVLMMPDIVGYCSCVRTMRGRAARTECSRTMRTRKADWNIKFN
jgi:DNA-binding CsgD family transcriptional regulator